ncbi:MAG: phospholipid scramblase-related protein [Planctomycetota bacterium]
MPAAGSSVFARNVYFVKEHTGILKAANNYDVYDPEDLENPILNVREEKLGLLTKLFRFSDYKRMTPFDIEVKDPKTGRSILRVHRGIAIFLSKVVVEDEDGILIGVFKQKLFSLGGAFRLLDAQEQEVGLLKGNWRGWEFTFTKGERQIGKVAKKWAGLAKELFTTADNYALEMSPELKPDAVERKLMLAACFCIDMVLKE